MTPEAAESRAPGRRPAGVHGLRRRCALVLVATALLTIVGAAAQHNQTAVQKRDALLINQSGRQRMLLNRTALLAQEMCMTHSSRKQNAVRDRMMQTVTLLESSHVDLLNGSDEIPRPEAEVRRLMEQIDPLMMRFVNCVRRLANTAAPEITPVNPDLLEIRETLQKEDLLDRLDRVVMALQINSPAKLSRVQLIQNVSAVSVILFLAMMGLTVFVPMTREVHTRTERLQEINTRLAETTAYQNQMLNELQTRRKQLRERTTAMTNILGDLKAEESRLSSEVKERKKERGACARSFAGPYAGADAVRQRRHPCH